ncbi:MAG: NTP transferase domain-containing protein [Actinomycetota bacterium]|nr:NTP transferase domain-containing protein [Actinomycetota bacterium]
MGRPKALVELAGVPLVLRALRALADGGCAPLLVVVGAAAEAVAAVVGNDALVVTASDWAEGMGASLRAGLAALDDAVPAAVVHLVDLPGVGAAALSRLAIACTGPDVLARAAYDGVRGHPVLLGRAHWSAVSASAVGDTGARGYLAGHAALQLVECADVADPRDVDTPDVLRSFGGVGAG